MLKVLLSCSICVHKGWSGISHVLNLQTEVIDINDDGDVNKIVVPESDIGVNVVKSNPGVVLETSEHLMVGDSGGT